MISRPAHAQQMDSKRPAKTSLANGTVLTEKPYMNRKLIHWANLKGNNNHCSNNCSPVMMLQRIVAVFSVAVHISPRQPFF